MCGENSFSNAQPGGMQSSHCAFNKWGSCLW